MQGGWVMGLRYLQMNPTKSKKSVKITCLTQNVVYWRYENESHKGNERVFSDRGREGLFLRAFGKKKYPLRICRRLLMQTKNN